MTKREAFFVEAGGYVSTPVYRREGLTTGRELHGPLIVEQVDTTTVIRPGQLLRVEADGSMVVESA